MTYIFAANSQEELQQYKLFSTGISASMDAFLQNLRTNYKVTFIPRCIVLTSLHTATQLLSDIPIPAYTNDFRTIFCPDLESWKSIYLQQLNVYEDIAVRKYYESKLSENHLLQILGHEFVHHSDLFIDEAYVKSIWFEEGMCEYISRRFFLTEQEFDEEARINALLVEHYSVHNRAHSLEDFSVSTYKGNYSDIFFAYWRSFLALNKIIDAYNGDIHAVFSSYHEWFYSGCSIPLSQWFRLK